MPNYRTSKIYEITSTHPSLQGKVYIGSTTLPIKERLQLHKTRCNDKSRTEYLYQLMRRYGKKSFQIRELVAMNAKNKTELQTREQRIIDKQKQNKLINTYHSIK